MTDRTVSIIPQKITLGANTPKPGSATLLDMSRCRFDGDGWKKLTHAEWVAEAKRRFGDDPFRWRFVCPSCGHIQSVADFRQFKEQGAQPTSATQLCIGRFTGAKGAFDPAKYKPCNYTANGLILLCTTVVVMPDGDQMPVFEFAEVSA